MKLNFLERLLLTQVLSSSDYENRKAVKSIRKFLEDISITDEEAKATSLDITPSGEIKWQNSKEPEFNVFPSEMAKKTIVGILKNLKDKKGLSLTGWDILDKLEETEEEEEED